MEWDSIKANPPAELKISPIATIPHKSRAYSSILDLSFRLRLEISGFQEAANNTTMMAPGGAINQIGKYLSRIIHAFAEAKEDTKIFMAKWDIKDGFWQMDCREGEEWYFAYVLPHLEGELVCLVVSTSLKMGWVESSLYFCAATEMAQDIAMECVDTEIGTRSQHKFKKYAIGLADYAMLTSHWTWCVPDGLGICWRFTLMTLSVLSSLCPRHSCVT